MKYLACVKIQKGSFVRDWSYFIELWTVGGVTSASYDRAAYLPAP